MKNVAVINVGDFSSVGRIATGLHQFLLDHNYNSHFFYCRGNKPKDSTFVKFEGEVERYIHALATRITGRQGCYSYFATKRLIHYLKEYKIDTIFGECLHGYYLNEKLLFEYIAKQSIAFVYVVIDEYPYLGKCWNSNGCTRYLIGCGKCPQKNVYPNSYLLDGSRHIFNNKLKLYPRMKRCVFAGPEFTMENARKSPLMKDIKTVVVDEGIDTYFFSPKDTKDLRRQLKIRDDQIVLFSNASYKYKHKGGQFFVDLARKFESDERFIFIHAGNEKEQHDMPKNYRFVGFVPNSKLPLYYSIADLFIFPSLQDAMPNACLESLSCGTPLLCFNISGLPYIAPSNLESLVEPENVESMAEVVENTKKKSDELKMACRNYAINRYDRNIYFGNLIKCAQSL